MFMRSAGGARFVNLFDAAVPVYALLYSFEKQVLTHILREQEQGLRKAACVQLSLENVSPGVAKVSEVDK